MADSEGQNQDTGASEDINKPFTIDHTKRKTEVDICPAVTSKEIREPEDAMANETRIQVPGGALASPKGEGSE
ncbi:hypothetical protein E2C01_081708 [Portunus trituberculatus]|uniref:Uncharacterized protein n=1 Tax=Portunus trituberculatus TaxID=210409 RepID=A0A5B7IN53_PORTR|nr:hypothetical protein [Portunus trituberculatus]